MPQSRKWQLTFNNPAEHGFTHDAIIAAIENLASVVYWCMCDEVGSEGTLHTHLYICFQNPKAHTVIANAFPGAHRENVKGTSQQNRDYVLKDGEKYNKQPDGTYDYIDGSGKRHQGTNYTDTFEEYYNPATGETSTITDWSYDYSDRSYNLTLEGGDTSTVTYGDENITITETTINESGDTIINNYTIYYIIDGTGAGTGSENPPAVCNHNWQEISTTPATCTVPGSRLLTCSLCNQTKTETIPALGHSWIIRQTVTTEYDDTGQLVQQGYTIFECTICGEQYKSTDGGAPPGGGSGTGSGSSGGLFSGIFGLLVDFLGFFWNTFHDFVGEGVKGFLSALTDGTSSIFGLLNPFSWGG